MKLELLDTKRTRVDIPYYHGTRVREIYQCPCGYGIVVYEAEDVPGNKDFYTIIKCSTCAEKYEIKDYLSRSWSIVEKRNED